MSSPQTISRGGISSNLLCPTNEPSGFKHVLIDGHFSKSKEIMGSATDLSQNHDDPQHQRGGLVRYSSAPSSFFANYLDGNAIINSHIISSTRDSSESESVFRDLMKGNQPINYQQNSGVEKMEKNEMHFSSKLHNPNGNTFCNGNDGVVQMGYQVTVGAGGGTVVGSYSLPFDGVENQEQLRINGVADCSNLVRQSSSPAGLFSGFNFMTQVSGSSSTIGDLNNHMNLASMSPCNSTFMPIIATNGNDCVGVGKQEDGQLSTWSNFDKDFASSHFSRKSWDDSQFNSLKRDRDGEIKMLSGYNVLENQDLEPRGYTSGLTRHLSLPITSVEMEAKETYLHFQQDSVPCKMRAKRGCATHPRSIAERMRRTRISERMKKLQDLFPDMDKQTSISDMLDLAVEHIKNLQKQILTLKKIKANCTCST